MRVFSFLLLLAVRVVVGGSEVDDLRGLVDVLVERNAKLMATVDELRTDFSELEQTLDELVASRAARGKEHAQWQQETTAKLQSSLAGRWRLSSAVSTQQRRLASSDTCGDPSGPTLLVEGVCSCTEGLLVEGRNITQELDELKYDSSADDSSSDIKTTLAPTALTSQQPTVRREVSCANRTDPVVVGSVTGTQMTYPRGVAASPSGEYVFVVRHSSHTLAVVDVGNSSSPSSPKVVGSLTDVSHMNNPYQLAVSPDGNYVYVAGLSGDSLAVVYVGNDPTNPTLLGSVKDSTRMDHAYGVAVSPDGSLVFVAGYDSDSVAVVDVGSDPSQPAVVGSIVGDSIHLDGALKVAASPDGEFVYVVATGSKSLAVVDVGSDPSNPVVVGSIIGSSDSTNFTGAFGIALSPDGHFAFVCSTKHFAVVDVDSDPSNPVVVGSIVGDISLDGARAVAVSPDGAFAFVAGAQSNSVAIVDVSSDRSNPVIVGSVVIDGVTMDAMDSLAVSPDGNHVYVTGTESDSFVVVDVCNDP